MGQQPRNLDVERRNIGKVHDADGAAANLVLIGRADAALGRADLGAGAIRRFAEAVEFLMQWQDQRRIVGQLQRFGADIDALPAQPRDLVEQREGIDDDAVADHAQLARPDDSRRQKAQFVGHAVDDERMPGVMAALEPDHDIGLLRQPIDNLSLALVAPLGADHHHIGHEP